MNTHTKPTTKTSLTLLFLLSLCMLITACTSVTITIGQPPTANTASSTPQGSTGIQGAQTSEQKIARSVFDAINKDRATAGLPALKWNDALVKGARQHNIVMMGANQLSHQLPGEPDLGNREKQQGIQWQQAAENIGFTEDISENGVLALHKAMMAEKPPDDGHRQNILDTKNTYLGVDVLFDSIHRRYWLTEDFALLQ
jgi:uncharacterized protein YkwD